MKRSRTRAAFTLLEVIVTLAIMSMVMIALMGTLTATVRGMGAAHESSRHARQTSGLERVLRHDIEGAYIASEPDTPAFVARRGDGGGKPVLEFYSTSLCAPEADRSVTGLVRVEYYVRTSERFPGTKTLLRRETPYTPGAVVADAVAAPEPLLDGLTVWQLSFFGDGRWREDWSQKDLPVAIRVAVSVDARLDSIYYFQFAPVVTPGVNPLPQL